MVMSDLKHSLMTAIYRYDDINRSAWFKEIIEHSGGPAKRETNQILVSFNTEEDIQKAIDVCKRRNILYSQSIPYGRLEWHLRIHMNWNKRLPCRIDRKSNLVLD